MRSSRIGITIKTGALLPEIMKKMKKMNHRETDLFYTIALTQIHGLGKVSMRQLFETFGSAASLFKAVDKSAFGEGHACELIKNGRDEAFRTAERELEIINKKQINVITIADSDYPHRLKQGPDAPLVLYA